MGIFSKKERFWFCLKHETVEPNDGCKNADRLGPYDSQAAAARALETVAERNEAWENDPNWNDADGSDGAGDTDAAGPDRT